MNTWSSLGLGQIRSGAYDVRVSGTGMEFASGWLNNGIFDIYARSKSSLTHYFGVTPSPTLTDPNLFYMAVNREEMRVNRIME